MKLPTVLKRAAYLPRRISESAIDQASFSGLPLKSKQPIPLPPEKSRPQIQSADSKAC